MHRGSEFQVTPFQSKRRASVPAGSTAGTTGLAYEPPLNWLAPIVAADGGATLAYDVDGDGHGDRPYYPWGFNQGPPLTPTGEPFDWNSLVNEFRDMHRMGVNIIRIGPTIRWILTPPTPGFPYGTPNPAGPTWLNNLLGLARESGMYVMLTIQQHEPLPTPDWYDTADEVTRWGAQALWWSQVAGVGKDFTNVALYDLKNEPSMAEACTGQPPNQTCPEEPDWGPQYNEHLVKNLRDSSGHVRDPLEVVQTWMTTMRDAIRVTAGDTTHLISISDLAFTGVTASQVTGLEDLVIHHVYPHDAFPPGSTAYSDVVAKLPPYVVPGQPTIVGEFGPDLFSTHIAVDAYLHQTKPPLSGWAWTTWAGTPATTYPPADIAGLLQRLSYHVFQKETRFVGPNGTGTMEP